MSYKMKLSEFIATTLTEIIDGVVQAQKYAKEHDATVNASGLYIYNDKIAYRTSGEKYTLPTPIDFDILLTIGQDDKEQGAVGIFAAAFGAGLKGEVSDYSENATRVKFQIVAQLPTQD